MQIGHRTLLEPASQSVVPVRPSNARQKRLASAVKPVLVAAAVLTSTFLRAQSPADPSGHWQGAIHIPNQEIAIEVDLSKKANGDTMATFTGVNIKGFPLSDVVIDGASVSFALKVDGGGAFSGKVSNDGKTLSGEFTTNAGGYTLPFDLSRSGDAKFEAPARNPRIGKELEGAWTGTLEANGTPLRILLKLANQADGTSTGSVATLDQDGVEIPVSAISQAATTVTIDVSVVGGSFTGTLNAAGTELSGTWSQRTFSAPLNFRRDK